jgi:hypothetical protein
MPEIVVAKTSHPPVIDGKMEPGEWDRAAAATGFTVAFAGDLAKNQSVFWVTYDDQYLYVCFKNYRGPHDDFLKKTARGDDDESIVFDHSNEIWITPPATPLATYQTLMNSYPAIYDCKKIPSVGYTSKSWRGNWTAVASETADYWIVEARAAIQAFGGSAIADGATWRALFTARAAASAPGPPAAHSRRSRGTASSTSRGRTPPCSRCSTSRRSSRASSRCRWPWRPAPRATPRRP